MPELRIPGPIRLFAPAKLNLGLEVCGRRPDGFHEVVTVMESVSLFDVIDLIPASSLRVETDDRIAPDDDLTLRAVELIQRVAGVRLSISIRVAKHIPIAAGLGGGSSDAGVIISAIGRMIGLPFQSQHQIAASIGSDVPHFLTGGTSLCTGTGTSTEPIPARGRRWYVVVVPDLEIAGKTSALYGRLGPDDMSDGSRTLQLAARLRRGKRSSSATVGNAFSRPLLEFTPFRNAIEDLSAAAGRSAEPSGAGPAAYTMCGTLAEAQRVYERIRTPGLRKYIVTSLGPGINDARLPAICPPD